MKKTQKKPQGRNARTSASKNFGKYKPEEERAVRVPEVKRDPALERMLQVWDSYASLFALKPFKEVGSDAEAAHELASTMLKGISYSSKTVTGFSICLSDVLDERFKDLETGVGSFINALVNNGRASRYEIFTMGYGSSIWSLGYRNTKQLIINGDGGSLAGLEMASGKIVINGNADFEVGCEMKGGIIIVKGNGGHEPGSSMDGGVIIIKGDAGKMVGDQMGGGEIHIEGDIESLGRPKGGKIYHKGKLVIDK